MDLKKGGDKMVNLLYDFILNDLIGDSTLPNTELLATLLTWTSIILIFGALVRFVIWLFKCVSGAWIWRR